MINLNNFLAKCSIALLLTYMQTSSLLAMDSDDKEENKPKHNHLASQTRSPIKMEIRFKKKFFRNNLFSNTFSRTFSDQEEAHDWFNAMISVAGMKRDVEQFNGETSEKNNAKKRKSSKK